MSMHDVRVWISVETEVKEGLAGIVDKHKTYDFDH